MYWYTILFFFVLCYFPWSCSNFSEYLIKFFLQNIITSVGMYDDQKIVIIYKKKFILYSKKTTAVAGSISSRNRYLFVFRQAFFSGLGFCPCGCLYCASEIIKLSVTVVITYTYR